MRKVKNNRAIKRLAKKSFAANRTRNLVAALAIALTAVLFTAVFTIGIGMVKDAEKNTMLQAGSDLHGVFKEVTKEQIEILKNHPSIKESGRDLLAANGVANPEFLKRHVELHFVEPNLYPHWFFHIVDGRVPEAADEILMDQKSMELLGAEPKAGGKVTLLLELCAGDAPVSRTFSVSGVIEPAEGMNVGFAIVSAAYLEEYAGEIAKMQDDAVSVSGKMNLDVLFFRANDLQGQLEQVVTDSGFSVDASDSDFIDSNANWAYLSESARDPMTMAGVAAALALIMLTGYLIIYNIFQLSVISDIRYYGLLKTIGTTARQIKRILRRQALALCVLGTPAGLLVGFFVGKVLLPVILSVGTNRGGQEIPVAPYPWIFIGAALFTILTTLLSEWKPGRIAAKVSPVEALHYTEQKTGGKRKKKSTDGGKPLRMAFSNLGRNKGRTTVVILSLSLTVVLMNSIYTVTGSIVRESFIAACKGQEGFLDGGRIYMTENGPKIPADTWEIPDYIPTDEAGRPGEYSPEGFFAFPQDDEGGYCTELHGIERFVLDQMTVVEGEDDFGRIWEKLSSGKFVLYSVDVDDDGRVIEESVKYHAGDTVTFQYPDGTIKEYGILAVVKGHTFSLTNRTSNIFPFYVSSGEFLAHFSDAYLMSFLFDVKKGQESAMQAFLEQYTSETEPAMSFELRETFAGMFDGMIGMIAAVGIGLAGMIGVIGALNFLNVMLTSVAIRRREFAMMEAIGMTKRQIAGMLSAEGVYYAALTTILSAAASALFSFGVIRMIGKGIWFMQYHFTLLPALLAGPVLLVFGAALPRMVWALRRKRNLAEEIRE